MATRKATAETKNFFKPDYTTLLDSVEKKFSLSSAGLSSEARDSSVLSTGILGTDLMLNGGILPGAWYTVFGAEQSAKSSHLMHILQGAINSDIPIINYYDYENSLSSSPDYFEAMLNGVGRHKYSMDDIFGVRDKNGKWVKEARARMFVPSKAEDFFDSAASMMRHLPDKQFLDGKWFYVYENTKPNRALVGDSYSKTLFTRFNKFYVEAENGLPQALLFLDSYPAMFPANQDEDEAGSGMAAIARMFAQNIPKIAGKLKSKSCTVIGVNQLRQRPGVSYGCFPYHARVMLADGTEMQIGDIVENKLEVTVLSYNVKTGLLEPKPVVDWYRNGHSTSKDYLSFEIAHKLTIGRGQKTSLKCTHGHLLMDSSGILRRADTFKEGEYFMGASPYPMLTYLQKQIILGSVLGDGWFIQRPGASGISFGIAHKAEHLEFIEWKEKLLTPLVQSKYGKRMAVIETRTINEPWMYQLYQESKAGVEHYRDYKLSNTLLREIDPLGLAIWYMDDGANFGRAKGGRKFGGLIKLQSFSPSDAMKLADGINDRFNVGLKFKEWSDKGSRKGGRGWGVEVDKAFGRLVLPFIHPIHIDKAKGQRAKDKVSIWYPDQYEYLQEENHHGVYPLEITKIRQNPSYNGQKYDLQVADNHLYVVDGVVVENSPEYEGGGEALKFVSAVRIRQATRSVPHGKGALEEEASVTGTGNDTYRYVHFRTIKNKLSRAYLENWERIWVSDVEGQAHGFCPVWDVFQYLKSTGQCEGTMKKMSISIGDFILPKLSFMDLKKLVLLTGEQLKEHCAKLGLDKNPKLREKCFEQIGSGVGTDLLYKTMRGGSDIEDADTSNDEDDLGEDIDDED